MSRQNLKLYNENCLENLSRRLSPGSVDVVVTSPPYNLGIAYNLYDDTESRDSYLDWIGQWAREIKQVLADDGSIFLNIGSKPSDLWGPHEVLFELRNFFQLQNEIHWIKSITIQPDHSQNRAELNIGHYKPINSQRYLNQCHEYIFHLTHNDDVQLDRKAIGVPYKDKSNIKRWGRDNQDLRCRGNTWFIPYETIQNRQKDRPHPASFPPALAEMAIKLHGLEKTRLVVDPFLGIGNSALAAQQLKLDFVGFEIDPDYLKTARERLGEQQRQLF